MALLSPSYTEKETEAGKALFPGSRLKTRACLLCSLICLHSLTFSSKLIKICQGTVLENPIFSVALSDNSPPHAPTHPQTK